jgi:hypothetical protein
MTTAAPEVVPCEFCSCPIERHTLAGCDHCPCNRRWTLKQIRAERARLDLPEQYNRWSL